jgi:regulator of nucleoside diphosphate kinase
MHIVTRERAPALTDVGRLRLREMMESLERLGKPFRGYLRQLGDEIATAVVVPAHSVERDVVTMNSHVRIVDLQTGAAESITLVYPTESDMLRSRLSVLTPLGIELLGQRARDVIEWAIAGGVRRIRIDRVLYQPEADGQFHL